MGRNARLLALLGTGLEQAGTMPPIQAAFGHVARSGLLKHLPVSFPLRINQPR